jgi:hypothetical protein
MNFIVQIDDTPTFLTELRDGQPYGAPHPTRAIQMGFDAANEIVQRLRKEGYESCVADQYRQLPTAADLAAVKRNVEFQVLFSGHYFVGVNAAGREQGSKDREDAKSMDRSVALEICRKLKSAGHGDATIVESNTPVADTTTEIEKIWPSQSQSDSIRPNQTK